VENRAKGGYAMPTMPIHPNVRYGPLDCTYLGFDCPWTRLRV